jgi:hypothetical protein
MGSGYRRPPNRGGPIGIAIHPQQGRTTISVSLRMDFNVLLEVHVQYWTTRSAIAVHITAQRWGRRNSFSSPLSLVCLG